MTPPNEFNANPQVLADGSGGFVAMWTDGEGSAQAVVSRAGSNGQFGPPEPVSGGNVTGANLAINADGDAAVAWIFAEPATCRRASPRSSPLPPAGASAPNSSCRPRRDEPAVAHRDGLGPRDRPIGGEHLATGEDQGGVARSHADEDARGATTPVPASRRAA